MVPKKTIKPIALIVVLASTLAGCSNIQNETSTPTSPIISEIIPISPTNSIIPTTTIHQPTPTLDLSDYAFPNSIDPAKPYMFYLHGKIIEDQGIPAISPDFGEYEYEAILKVLSGYGFVVISEPRPKNTDSVKYARRIVEQITTLLEAGVPAKDITVVGASKGAGIGVFISYFLENEEVNFVLMAVCHPDEVEYLKQNHIYLYGNVLSIYDSVDEFAGTCQDLFALSEGKGISKHKEIVLDVGTGHGILYKPLDEWITPVIEWAGKP